MKPTPAIPPVTYPAHDHRESKETEEALLKEFVNWLEQRNLSICEMVETDVAHKWVPPSQSDERIIAEFLGIDLDGIERERRLMLHASRELQK